MDQLRYLLPYFRRYRTKLVTGVASIFLAVAIGLVTPLLVGWAVDALRQDVDAGVLVTYAALVVGIAALRGVFTFLQRVILVTMSRDIELDLREVYFQRLETYSQRFFSDSYTGDLMARGTNDLQAVRMLCGPAVMYSSNTLFTALGALALMVQIDWRLTLVALATMPLVAVTTKVFGEKIHVLFTDVQENFSTLSTRVQENLSGVRVVRAYAQERGERRRFDETNREAVERNRRLIRWNAAFHPMLQTLVGLGFVAVLWYGGVLVIRGSITVGEFVTFNLFLNRLIWPMIAIGWVINLIQRGTASLKRMRSVLEHRPTVIDDPDPVRLDEPVGHLAMRDLTFAYPTDTIDAASDEEEEENGEGDEGPDENHGTDRAPAEPPSGSSADRPVLEDVSFEAPAGTLVALVGRTGSGKSTLLSLLPRIWDPPRGSVFFDGVDVRSLALEDLRSALGVVPQESFLFSTTVRENIAYGRPDADDEDIARAARMAGLTDDLEGFPKGLDTVVGERGITLSGGQKQRVALARALIRRPRVLILDDSLSAVDTHTEETILGHLRTVFEGRTVLLVSHRISTVQNADLILVLERGRIVERGDHAELLRRGGLYAELAERQQLEEELARV